MADDTNEDSWLYGTSIADSKNENVSINEEDAVVSAKEVTTEQTDIASTDENIPQDFEPKEEPLHDDDVTDQYDYFEEDNDVAAAEEMDGAMENTEIQQQQEYTVKENVGSEEDDLDDSDDDINVVIGDIKAAPSTYNIKQRANLLAGTAGQEKSKGASQGGKFTIDDFEGVGTINGVPAHEFSIDSLEEKPWRKPGADITDYFNYGFNEETWRAYCERQKRFRVAESGVGLASLTQNINQSNDKYNNNNNDGSGMPNQQPMHVNTTNLSIPGMNNFAEQMQMPPPNLIASGAPMLHGHGPRMGPPPRGPRPLGPPTSKENAIQVMTAECREYSRPGSTQMPPNFPPGPTEEPFFPETDAYDYGYEPTQESQWNNDNPNWIPSGIKELTPGPLNVPPPQMGGPPGVPGPQGPMGVPPPQMVGPPPQMRPHPSMMPGMPPPNMGMGPMPNMGSMMMGPGNGPPMRMPIGPPRMPMGPMGPGGHPDMAGHMMGMRERERERSERRDRERDRRDERDRDTDRERDRDRDYERERSSRRDRERDRDRDYDRERSERRDRERDRDGERDRNERDKTEKSETESERADEDRERRRRERERERERERDRERSRRDRSKSREKSRRRSKSRDKERERSSKNNSSSASSSSRSDKKKSSSSSQRKDEDE